MPKLSTSNVSNIMDEYMRDKSRKREVINLNKIELRAAIESIDDNENVSDSNRVNVLPVDVRSKISNVELSNLTALVATKRYEVK